MRILFVSEHYHKNPSGPRKAAASMAEALSALGHEVDLLGVMAGRDNDEALPGGGQAQLRRYRWKPLPVRFGRPRFNARLMRRIHGRRPVDVVLAMGFDAADAARRFRDKTGVPFVLNPRSFLVEKPGDWKFDRAVGLMRDCDAFIALSEMAADSWCEATGYARDAKVFGRLNGVDTNDLQGETEKPSGINEAGRLILSMGMLRGPKGHHFILRALARVCMDLDWHLAIAGKGPWEQKLKEQAVELGIAERVTFTGMVTGAHWRWLYRNADVFALYSVYKEACGNAFLEAQAAGLPVITSDQGSLPEVIRHGETGLITAREPKSTEIERIGEAIRKLLTDKALRKQLGDNGRERAAELTWKHCVEGYLEAMRCAMSP